MLVTTRIFWGARGRSLFEAILTEGKLEFLHQTTPKKFSYPTTPQTLFFFPFSLCFDINRRSQGMSGHRFFEWGGLSTAQYLLTSSKSRAASLRSALSLLHAASFGSAVREARCPSRREERRRDFVRVDMLYMLIWSYTFFLCSIVQYISILVQYTP